MKIILLLVLKCLSHSKIIADEIYELHPRDIISAQTSLLDEASKPIHLRVKRDSSANEFLAFDPEDLDRSPRRKREVRNQNQIFFRRRKKKMYRQSKIRRSLFRRGKFTTATPYSYLKKIKGGKGKLVRPPGLKYRKKYRFNRFKKTQDVAFGIGEGGRAKVLQSQPKKRPPIHVRDYDRGRGTRKALRGRVGERKTRDDDDRFRKGADRDRKKARIYGSDRATVKKSENQYYDDDLRDYSSEMAKDSLPKQARKAHVAFGKLAKTYPWANETKRKKVTKSSSKHSTIDHSSDDNTLLLSDEEQLTDVSSDISDLRSEIPDKRPKHRKNVSSSEYEQYSYAEDDSAIVSGEIVASKDESSPLKTTLLGPINYDQYDIKKLDASIERVFKKSKKQNAALQYDDPLEDIEAGYKDETSYESSSDTKQLKQKGRKSKPKFEKSKPQPKTGREPKAKHERKQIPKAKLKKDAAKSDSYDDAKKLLGRRYPNLRFKKESESDEGTDKLGSEDEDEEEHDSEDEDAEEYDSEDEDAEEYDSKDENRKEYDSEDEDGEGDESESEGEDGEAKESESEDGKANDSEDEYTSDEEQNYEEMSTPKRRIPTWKMTQDPNREKLYEEYTDTENEGEDSKPRLNSEKNSKLPSSKASSKKKLPPKKGDKTSIQEYEDYESEYSDSQSQDQKRNSIKPDSISKKNIKMTTRKSISKKSVTTKSADTSDYGSEHDSEEYSETDTSSVQDPNKSTGKKTLLRSGKMIKEAISDGKTTKKRPSSIKPDSTANKNLKTTIRKSTSKKSATTKSADTSDYESEYDSDKYSDTDASSIHNSNKGTQKKISLRSGKIIEEISDGKITKKGRESEKGHDTSPSNEYESNYSDENDENETSDQATKKPLKSSPKKKITSAKKNAKPPKNEKISTYESKEYGSDYTDDESPYSEKTTKKGTKFGTPPNTIKPPVVTFKPLPVRVTKSNKAIHSKSTFKQLVPTTKKSPDKTSKKKPTLKKNSETYEESEYDSQVTSYEESSENATDYEEDVSECATWPKEDLVERATWPEEDLKQSGPLQTLGYNMFFDGSEERGGSAEANEESAGDSNSIYDKTEPIKTTLVRKTEPTKTTLVRKTKPTLIRETTSTLSAMKRTKKGFSTLLTTLKEFDSEEALKKISSKAAAITQKHVFVYNTKRKAYEIVSLKPINPTTLEITSPAKDPSIQSKTTLKTSLQASDNTTTSHAPEKTLKKRIVYKKTTSEVNHDLLESTFHIPPVGHSGTKKTTKKRASIKTTLAGLKNITQKRTRKKTSVTGSLAEERAPL